MISERKIEIVLQTAQYFPERIKSLIKGLPEKVLANVSEIRLRSNRPLCLTVSGENLFISESGHICHLFQHGLYIVTAKEIETAFCNMCDHSVYAYTDQIKHGFIALKNGCRAGLAASAVYDNGVISGFSRISSINVRIAAEYIGCAQPLAKYLTSGLLIAGPPSSGKTTLLRDAVRLISNGYGTARRRVAVIDTRGEIAAVSGSIPQSDIGPLTDVITGCKKCEGIEIALRTLSPEVIAFDEIGNMDEAEAVLKSFHAGANTVCSIHAGSESDLVKRDVAVSVLGSSAIKYVAFVDHPGADIRISKVEVNDRKIILEPVQSQRCSVCLR